MQSTERPACRLICPENVGLNADDENGARRPGLRVNTKPAGIASGGDILEAQTHLPPIAFLSYARRDNVGNPNRRGSGPISKLAERIREAVTLSVPAFDLLTDRDSLQWGELWASRLDELVSVSTFLIPILTPAFLESEACLHEFEVFCQREDTLGRTDLVMPIVYNDDWGTLPTAEIRWKDELLAHQYSDWRDLRFSTQTKAASLELHRMGVRIRRAIETSGGEKNQPPGSGTPGKFAMGTFESSEDPAFVEAFRARLQTASNVVMVGTGLHLLWDPSTIELINERLRLGVTITICIGDLDSPAVALRLQEEAERKNVVLGSEDLRARVANLVYQLGADGLRPSLYLFANAPTFAVYILDSDIFFYPYGHKVLGLDSPVFHVRDNGGREARFFRDHAQRVIADSTRVQ
jgi:hypothetical protein